jgi:hypothetical protein
MTSLALVSPRLQGRVRKGSHELAASVMVHPTPILPYFTEGRELVVASQVR